MSKDSIEVGRLVAVEISDGLVHLYREGVEGGFAPTVIIDRHRDGHVAYREGAKDFGDKLAAAWNASIEKASQ